MFSRASIACSWCVGILRWLQLRQIRQELSAKNTVTDLLIGDLFTDRVDKFGADGVAYEEGEVDSRVGAGAARSTENKVNELFAGGAGTSC